MKTGNLENSRCSRGYCGYFTTRKNNILYLRSMKEFIVATWLSNLESDSVTLFGEWYIGNYRPDFRLEINNKTRYIFEVKDNRYEAEKYIKLYKKSINDLGYHYIVIFKQKHFNKLINRFNIDIEQWKKNSIYDYSGANNPKFGIKCSIETKQKIGDKTRERSKNVEYINNIKEKIKKSFTPERRELISNSTKKHAIIRREKRDLEDPMVDVFCVWCNTTKKKRLSKVKEIEFCDARCAMPYYKSINAVPKMSDEKKCDRFKKNLIQMGRKIKNVYGQFSLDYLLLAKQNGILYRNAQISEKSIIKYFQSILNFIKEL
jgi:hypothetical protein